MNRGQKILLRLRYPRDKSLFLSMEEVTDTMLHELCHIVHGPHDGKFHALWNQLRDEHEALIRKGYTGEGFLGDGHRLGGSGRRIPMHEARRLARAAAERRSVLSAGSGQRLGGAAPRPGTDIRRVIAGAVERRNMPEQGCGNLNHNEKEINAISESATRNGFRTQAEEDEANEAAIAQALWELVQEDEKAKYGKSYNPASAEHPEASQPVPGSDLDNPSSLTDKASRSLYETHDRNTTSSTSSSVPQNTGPTAKPVTTVSSDEWACSTCTLHNPADYLCCDACGSPRTEEQTKQLQQQRRASKRPRAVVDLTSSPQGKRPATGSTPAGPDPPKPATWQCSWCGKEMERMWWTCAACGRMKDNSR